MRKVSGTVVWTKPMSLSRAAKLLSRFSAVDNGSSAAVSVYLQRTSEAFSHLVQFHSKRIKMDHLEDNPNSPRRGIPPIDSETGEKRKQRSADNGDEVVQLALKDEQEQEQRKEKRTKKRRNTEVHSNRKGRRIEGVD